jgi:hypothetical protein
MRTVYAATESVSRGRIRQILFDSRSELLLVCDAERLQVLRFADSSIVAKRLIEPTDMPAKWSIHPRDPNTLIAFTASEVRVFSWDNLKMKSTIPYSVLHSSPNGKPESLVALEATSTSRIPLQIAECIEQPVGILADGRLVFLDKALWVCTAQLKSPATRGIENVITKHFFVPREWIDTAGLALCKVLADEKFLCPSKGEMAVIRSNIGTDW